MGVTCGIDWSETHHDVALVDQTGLVLAKRRIGDDVAGFTALMQLLADHGDTEQEPIPVAVETDRGLLIAAVRATGRPVYSINPLAVDRYRERHTVARRKSDTGDAIVLANILRTDAAAHRPLPADSELVRAIKVLARSQQDAVWERTRAQLRLRSLLREFYPAALAIAARLEDGLTAPLIRRLLAVAPTPTAGAALTLGQLEDVLRQAGRQRNIAKTAAWLHEILNQNYLRQPRMVEDALGHQTVALLRVLDTACHNADTMATAATAAFTAHPDAAVITSFPGMGPVLGARLLGEIGDDRTRFTDAKALKAYAGAAPVTRASGRSRAVFTRKVKNQRLAAAGYQWAFSSLTASPGARAHYDRRRATGDTHTRAQRNLYNRFLGMLHHCLATGQPYQEHRAFPAPVAADEPPIAA